MIRLLDLRGKALTKAGYQKLIPRASLDIASAMKVIEPILMRVKSGSEEDLLQLAQDFDGIRPNSIRVPQSAVDQALAELDPKFVPLLKNLQTAFEKYIKIKPELKQRPKL